MAKKLPPRDAVIVGLGWTGSILAHELCDAGLSVTAIERGPWRDPTAEFTPAMAQDELRFRIRHDLFLRPSQTSLTFRNNVDQTALPVRTWGAFMLGNGAGGGGLHWNAETWRFLPSDFVLKSHLTQRYGASFLPADMTIQDWGVTFDDLEPHYDKFEYLCGTSGTAGNIRGQIQEGGNPFEGPRSRPYPTPAQKQPFGHTLFGQAARELGYKPFPQPSGNLSQAYTNPLGVKLGPCTYCGFCEWFACVNYSKASPQTTILPVLVRKQDFEARTNCEVTRINLDRGGKRATGVTFVDSSGQEWEQPADLVLLCAFQLFNVQLLLLSGIGQAYDPRSGQGQIGRNYTHQTTSTAIGFFDKAKYNFNPFISSGSIGMCIDEFNGDNFDHGPLGFVGGGYLGQVQTNGRPIESTLVPPGTPAWGSAWKRAVRDNYLSTVYSGAGVHASWYAYRNNYLDLDPTYKDRFGRPLLRMTMDLHENELKMNAYLTDKYAEIVERMGAKQVVKRPRTGPYDITAP
jgi:gluconate 2-dehydrogenase alpha chain